MYPQGHAFLKEKNSLNYDVHACNAMDMEILKSKGIVRAYANGSKEEILHVGARIDSNFDPLIVIYWNGINSILDFYEMPFAGMINNYGLSNPFSSSWFTINSLRVARGDGDEQDDHNGIK